MNEGIAGGRRPLGRLIMTVAAICAGLLACAGTAAAKPAEPAVFDVGAASVSINPDTPQYISGYGYKGGPTTNVHDPLEVRAFVVSNGTDASAFVVADLTGWFSAYQGNLEPYGTTHVREAAAAELEAAGLTAERGSVIVSSTHTHSAPTTTGIWGKTDPAYMKKLRDAAIKAVHDAAADMKPSEVWTANGNVRSFVWQNGQGTNHPDGFSVDETAADHVGPRPRHRGDERSLCERPQPPRSVQRGRQRPVLRRLARLRTSGARRASTAARA